MEEKLLANLLGTPSFSWQGEILNIPTRKATALLCYLAACKSAVSREELSELLWGKPQSHAMRNELYRLRQLPGACFWLEETNNQIILNATSDLTKFEEARLKGSFREALEIYSGESDKILIRNLKPKDAWGFIEWLETKRSQLEDLLKDTLQRHILELEKSDKLTEALELANCLLERDLLDESTHRTIIRIGLRKGDLKSAQAQFEACRRVLAEELGIQPMPETLELAQEIERAIQKLPSNLGLKLQTRIPPKFLHPPVLVGREYEWARMETAWQKGQTIMISGSSGVGKTRLMLDFAHAKGSFSFNEGRPGDATLPFSTLTRYYDNFLRTYPEVVSELEPWVKYELARFLPQHFNKHPKPINSNEERARFENALFLLGKAFVKPINTLCADDLQFYDSASFEVVARITARGMQSLSSEEFATTITCFRLEEMPTDFKEIIEQHVETGLAIHIDLEPLNESGVAKLLEALELSDPYLLAQHLQRTTGGNPQFIIEVLKSLYEQGWQGTDLPEHINLPKKVGATIEKRLNLLSNDALLLAQTIAIFKQTKAIRAKELARILGMRFRTVTDTLAELEQAQIVRDGTFPHDLLFETVLNAMPRSTYRILNEQVAEWLETQNAEPARIAHHWTEAGIVDNALPWRIKAAEVILAQGSTEQARIWLKGILEIVGPKSELYRQASNLLNAIN